MTPNQDFWNIIIIVIAFDSLYEDFNMTITNLLEANDKIINKI